MVTVTRAAMEAVYAAACGDPEARRLRAVAREWRARGDHAAAGLLEKDAAAAVRAAHRRLAAAWDADEQPRAFDVEKEKEKAARERLA